MREMAIARLVPRKNPALRRHRTAHGRAHDLEIVATVVHVVETETACLSNRSATVRPRGSAVLLVYRREDQTGTT